MNKQEMEALRKAAKEDAKKKRELEKMAQEQKRLQQELEKMQTSKRHCMCNFVFAVKI